MGEQLLSDSTSRYIISAFLKQVKRVDLVLKAMILISLMWIFQTSSAFAESSLQINIDGGEAEEMLMLFAQQTDLSIVFDPRQLDGITTNRVEGVMLPSVALEQMLEGTQLVSDQDKETGAFAVTRVMEPLQAQTNINPSTSKTSMNDKNERLGSNATQPRNVFSRLVSGFMTAIVVSSTPAVAQDNSTAEPVFNLDEFEVVGFRSSLANSLKAKKNANQVTDSISAEEVGQMADQNIAEAIQRLSGVSLTRNNGEGEAITIRGLSPTFTRVEIDGRSTSMTMDESDPERATNLSSFSSDLYTQIEVIKSPVAADIEGGIGGIVRLKTPEPLALGKRAYALNVKYSDADLRDEADYNLSGFYSDVYQDGKLGFLLSATYKTKDRRIDKIQSNQDWDEVTSGFLADEDDPVLQALAGSRFADRIRLESRAGEAPNYNINAKLQYKITPKLTFFVNGLMTKEDREEDRSRIQVQFSRGELLGGTRDPETDTLVAGEFNRQRTEFRSFTRAADITNNGLTTGFNYEGTKWNVDFEFDNSSSEEDFFEWRADARINRDGVGGYDTRENPRKLILYTAGTLLDLEDIDIRGLQLQHRIIKISEWSGKLDVRRTIENGFIEAIQAGARIAETEFTRRQGAVAGQTEDAEGNDLTYADGNPGYVLDGNFGFGQGPQGFLVDWPSIDPVPLYEQYPSDNELTFNDDNFFDILEENNAAYAMVDFGSDTEIFSYRGNLGVRAVKTQFSGQGRIRVTTVDASYQLDDEPALESDYTEILPSFNIVLNPSGDGSWLIRSAITRAMTRPTIPEINPSVEINYDDLEIIRGNPELDPFLAWQYDLGLEYYFGESSEGLFSVTFFMKDVENFIVSDQFEQVFSLPSQGLPEETFEVNTYANGGAADVNGFEVNFQTPFTFLPDFWSNFGLAANYTFTDSEFTDEFGNSFPFPGASENTYNLILYYEQGGFSTRVAYNFRDDYLTVPSPSADGLNTQFGADQGRLDFALRYRWDNGFRVFFDVMNITEEQGYLYYDTQQRLENFEFEGRIWTFGMGYRY